MMKRIILEWGMVFLVGTALAIVGIWAGSRFLDRSTYHLRIATSRSVQDDLHVLIANGDLALCDQFDVDAAGNVRPLVIDVRNVRPADIRRGDRFGGFAIPGLEARYYRIARDGYLIWSLRLSLLIPAAIFFMLELLLLKIARSRRAPTPGSMPGREAAL